MELPLSDTKQVSDIKLLSAPSVSIKSLDLRSPAASISKEGTFNGLHACSDDGLFTPTDPDWHMAAKSLPS